jgi:hypothetical protein
MPKRSAPRWTVAGNSPIRIDRDIAAELRQAAAELVPDALSRMEAEIDALRLEVERRWPVSPTIGRIRSYRESGNREPSANLWASYGTVTSAGLVGSLGNPAPYIRFVKSDQNGLSRSQTAYKQLVSLRSQEVAKKIGASLAASIVRTVTSET